ncbi:MAG: ABC transporter ATP-binding protein [Psychrobacillus psychrotolerans]
MSARRRAIESLYKGICTIYEQQKVKDPITHQTTTKEVMVLENQKCKLSYEKITSASQTTAAATIAQSTKLFIAPELVVKAGSKIVVTQHGRTSFFSQSGEPAVYMDHQEVKLELFKEYA